MSHVLVNSSSCGTHNPRVLNHFRFFHFTAVTKPALVGKPRRGFCRGGAVLAATVAGAVRSIDAATAVFAAAVDIGAADAIVVALLMMLLMFSLLLVLLL